VDVDEDTGVGGRVGTGELDSGGRSASAAGDAELTARGVELNY
jgi:hypothetical protein